MSRWVSALFGAVLALVALVAPARAQLFYGTFAGVISQGTDVSHIFGTTSNAQNNLAGLAITGAFTYDIQAFTSHVVGDTNNATGNHFGALSFTVVILGNQHLFSDQTSSFISLDAGISEIQFRNANNSSGLNYTVSESFAIDAWNPITPFIFSTSLGQNFNVPPWISSGAFTIHDTGTGAAEASAVFDVTSLLVPEPASLSVLLTGLVGIALRRLPKRQADRAGKGFRKALKAF